MANGESGTKALLTIFVGLIIAIVFLSSISDSVFEQTNTFTETNITFTVPAINVTTALLGRDLVGAGTVDNSTFSSVTGAAFFTGITIADGLVAGAKTVTVTVNDTASGRVGDSLNASYTYNPDGYLTSSSDRNIANLIIIFGALAGVVFIVVMLAKPGVFSDVINFNGRSRRKK